VIRRGTVQLTALALAVPFIAACSGPQSTLDPAGPMARDVAVIWWVMCGFSAFILLLVSGLWIHAMRRPHRTYSPAEAKRWHGFWIIGGGIVLPTASVVLLLIFGIPAGQHMLPSPVEGEQPLRIEVTGHQWWWEVRYPESGVVTANQLHLPAGRPVDLTVTSADVIHSFWVPRLGGKIDMVPGHHNQIRLQADEPGKHRGQCAEFCGTQHSRMVLHVEAHTPDNFARWIEARQDRQIAPPPAPAGDVFVERCGICHSVAGISQGQRAPDLSDLGSRPTLGSGVLVNDKGAILRWLQEHQRLKPGTGMPSTEDVAPAELETIARWLEGLAP